jgi:hypothetical protein
MLSMLDPFWHASLFMLHPVWHACMRGSARIEVENAANFFEQLIT